MSLTDPVKSWTDQAPAASRNLMAIVGGIELIVDRSPVLLGDGHQCVWKWNTEVYLITLYCFSCDAGELFYGIAQYSGDLEDSYQFLIKNAADDFVKLKEILQTQKRGTGVRYLCSS